MRLIEMILYLVKVLVAFFRGKLEDTETIVPALKGLVALVTKPAFGASNAVDVMQGWVQILLR